MASKIFKVKGRIRKSFS